MVFNDSKYQLHHLTLSSIYGPPGGRGNQTERTSRLTLQRNSTIPKRTTEICNIGPDRTNIPLDPQLYGTLKVEKFTCTNFREKKISRRLIFATEDFIYFAVTYFREFREWRNFCVFRVEELSRFSRVVDFLNFGKNLFSNWGPVIFGLGRGTLVFDHPTIP